MLDHAAQLKACYDHQAPVMRRMAYSRTDSGLPHADSFILEYLKTHLQQVAGVNGKELARWGRRARRMLSRLQGRPWKRVKADG